MPTEQELFFKSVYRNEHKKLIALAYSKVRNRAMAEELVQDTFASAWADRDVFCQHEKPPAYLKKTLKFKVKEYDRQKKRCCKLFLSMDHELSAQVAAPSNASPISIPGILETVREVLTEDEWYILWQFAMKDASHRQIAEALGISVPASYKRLERIRKKLENVLPK